VEGEAERALPAELDPVTFLEAGGTAQPGAVEIGPVGRPQVGERTSRAWRRETPSSWSRTCASGLRPTTFSSAEMRKLRPTVPEALAVVTTSQAVTGWGWVVGIGSRLVVSSLTSGGGEPEQKRDNP